MEGQAAPPQNGPPQGKAGRSAPTPVEAVYRIALDVSGRRHRADAPGNAANNAQDGPERVTRGIVRVEGEARSIAERFWRVAASVVIRETGF